MTDELRNWADIETLRRDCSPVEEGGQWIFRGQAKYCWGLQPSLQRLVKQLRSKDCPDKVECLECPKKRVCIADAARAEEEARRNFEVASLEIEELKAANRQERIVWWAAAQHYGGVSRTLDWSGRLGVAVYFAIIGHFDKDGAVFALNKKLLEVSGASDESTKAASNFGDRPDGWGEMNRNMESGDHLIVHVCCPTGAPARMRVQYGHFTTCTNLLASQDKVIKEKHGDTNLRKLRVPSAFKVELLRECRVRGFSAAMLYCDSSERFGYMQREQVILGSRVPD